MKILEKIKFKVRNKKIREIRFLGIPFIRYRLIKYKNKLIKNRLYFLPIKFQKNNNTQAFYLKINRNDDISYSIFQQWINIVHYLNSDLYILCDKDEIKYEIYKRINFYNYNINFVKSDYHSLKNIVRNLTNKVWFNAGCAHLTTFKHSQKRYNSFWNIDADDTLFCIENEKVAKILIDINDYAITNNIVCFSLDMWRTITNKEHWSFGVTYIDNRIDWLKIINKTIENGGYKKETNNFNIDWFFTYLKKITTYKIETFYIENLKFIHYGNFLIQPIGAYFYHWRNGLLIIPQITDIFNTNNTKTLKIADDVIAFYCKINEQDNFKYISNKGNI